jgi:hypothetical protein
MNYGKCKQCGKPLDGISYFAGIEVCENCCRKNHKKVMGKE